VWPRPSRSDLWMKVLAMGSVWTLVGAGLGKRDMCDVLGGVFWENKTQASLCNGGFTTYHSRMKCGIVGRQAEF